MLRVEIQESAVVVEGKTQLARFRSDILLKQEVERNRSAKLIAVRHSRNHNMRASNSAVKRRHIVDTGIAGPIGRYIRCDQFDGMMIRHEQRFPLTVAVSPTG